MANVRKTRVEIPQKPGGPESHRMVAIVAGLGLLVGIVWPILAGKHLGPNVPGIKKEDDDVVGAPGASAAPAASSKPVSLAGVSSSKESEPATASSADSAARQVVTVDGGTIAQCWHGKEKLEGDRCGSLKLDRTVVPLLRQLDTCPAGLGLTGDLGVALDFDFPKKSIDVRRAKARGSSDDARESALPKSTVDGVIACVRDYLAAVAFDRIAHEHSRYRVEFGLHFRAHAEAPTARTDEEAPAGPDAKDDLATIVWDSAPLRDEPKGKVVTRLVRGTRVKILGSRKEWFEVKMGSRKGWLYRSAIGR